MVFPEVIKCFVPIEAPFKIVIHDIHAEAFRTTHNIRSIGWILIENPSGSRRLVISGDTRPSEAIINASTRADLLIHEATYLEKHASMAVAHWHSTVTEAADIAIKSGAGGLAITHIPSRYSTRDVQIEIEKVFPGAFVSRPLVTIYIATVDEEAKREVFGWGKLTVRDQSLK
jgi:ribonuclease BN (tRNA processing enzyme)